MAVQQQAKQGEQGKRSKGQINWLWWAANAAAAWPLLLMVWEYFQGTLGIDIVNAINNRTGRTAIILLVASLACTPLNILSGWRQVLTLRKSLGLWAFAYALLHLLNFVGLDYAFNVAQIFQDAILSKPYILAGLLSLLILLPLAATSTRGAMRRLGRNWKRLHRLAYAAGVLAVLHFLWQAKAAERWEPLVYAAVLALLLLVRVPSIRQAIVRFRERLQRGVTSNTNAHKTVAVPMRSTHQAGVQQTLQQTLPPADS
jgi:sulfoxide reductase heme-binding subunit YedZ